MFAKVNCPACQHKFTIPEGDMGKRQVCPNCRSPFFAGGSVAEAPSPMPLQPAAAAAPDAGYNKTMLGDSGPPIKFNCPRCKAPLEAPSIEAGIKKPCPACGQRLQVPAASAPPAAAAAPNLNKTLLASDESSKPVAPPIKYNCPSCKKPLESPASEALTKKPCPACGQRLQVPAAPAAGPNPNKTLLASDESRPQTFGVQPGYAPVSGAAPGAPAPAPAGPPMIGSIPLTPRNLGIGLGAFLLLFIIIPSLIRGGSREDTAAVAKAQQELDKLKAEIDQRKDEFKKRELFEEKIRRQLDDLEATQRRQDDQMHARHTSTLATLTDNNEKKKLMLQFEEEKRLREQEKRDNERNQQKILADAKAAADASKAALDAAQQNQKTQQTIIQQPPVVYYPPYHYRHYAWWW